MFYSWGQQAPLHLNCIQIVTTDNYYGCWCKSAVSEDDTN